MCSCFAFKLQAQITKVDDYQKKIGSLKIEEKEDMEFLFFGPVSQLNFSGTEKPVFTWQEQGPVKKIEMDWNQIDQLKNEQFLNSFKTVTTISIFLEKEKTLPLTVAHLSQFKNLKYLLIKGYDQVEIDKLKELLKVLMNDEGVSSQLEIIYMKMELPS